jgi:hypothetical protein
MAPAFGTWLVSGELVAKTGSASWPILRAAGGARNLVAKAGIEPATHGFSVRCSTN